MDSVEVKKGTCVAAPFGRTRRLGFRANWKTVAARVWCWQVATRQATVGQGGGLWSWRCCLGRMTKENSLEHWPGRSSQTQKQRRCQQIPNPQPWNSGEVSKDCQFGTTGDVGKASTFLRLGLALLPWDHRGTGIVMVSVSSTLWGTGTTAVKLSPAHWEARKEARRRHH